MKFVVFNGSPSGPASSTNVIARAFLQGAEQAGAETENIFLAEKTIGHCKGCFSCWFRSPGKCVQEDDMQELLQIYSKADVVCFATPVYTWNMTAYLKNFADRLIPLKSPAITEQNNHFDLADAKPKMQKIVIISNCGFPGEHNFEVMKAVFACCNPCLEIYRNCGKLLKSRSEEIQEIVKKYLAHVRQAGYEMAAKGYVSEETKRNLQMQLMPVSEYVKYIGM